MTELNVSEEELRNLIASAQASEPDAWALLYRRSYRRLFAYARRRLPDQSRTHTAVDEAFEHAFNRIGSFRPRKTGFDAWLFGILRSVIFEYQSQRKGTWSNEGPKDGGKAAPPPPDPDPDSLRVRSAFKQVSPEGQEVLELRVIGGLASQEVAAILNKGVASVRSAQSEAANRLSELLDQGGKETIEADRLFELLNVALLSGVPYPPQDAIAAVRNRAGLSRVETAGSGRGPSRTLVVALMVVVFIGGVLLGSRPPDLLREGLHRAGMPVDSPAMVQTRRSMQALARALEDRDRLKAENADREMLENMRELGPEEREELAPLAQQIHVRALDLLGQPVGE